MQFDKKIVKLKPKLGTKLKFFKETYCQNHSVISQCQNENECFSWRGNCRTQWKNALQDYWRCSKQDLTIYRHKIHACISYNPFNVNVVVDVCQVRQPFVTNLLAVEMKLTEMQELAVKISIQSHSTVDFWRQVPESKSKNLSATHFCI